MGFNIFILHAVTHVRGVIRGIPLDASMEEVVEIINLDNSIKTTHAFRLKRRNTQTSIWEDSQSVYVELKCRDFPDKILIWRTVIYMSLYILSVRLCYKCGKIGHIFKNCVAEERCFNCSDSHEASKKTPYKEKKCINFGESHFTKDKSCPVYKRHVNILKYIWH